MWIGPRTAVGEALVQGARPLPADQRANHRGGTTRRCQAARSRLVDGRYGARRLPVSCTVHTAQCHAAEFASVRRQLRDAHDVGQSVAKMCRQSTSTIPFIWIRWRHTVASCSTSEDTTIWRFINEISISIIITITIIVYSRHHHHRRHVQG